MIIQRNGLPDLDVGIDEGTLLNHSYLGEHKINAVFKLPTFGEINIGDTVLFKSNIYTVHRTPIVKKEKANSFVYNVDFMAPQYSYENALLMLDGLNDFSVNGTLETFMVLIRDNMNRAAVGAPYSLGTYPATGFRNIQFNQDNCFSALQKVCREFDMEYKLSSSGYSIDVGTSLGTVTGLTFEFKQGLRDIERKELSDYKLVTRLFAYGAERNISLSDYGYRRLVLDNPDRYIENNVSAFGIVEGSKIFEEVYPRKNGALTSIDSEDILKFTDSSMDFDINDYLMNTPAKITFNTGLLSGYEFEIAQYNPVDKEFTIIPIETDLNKTLPNSIEKPAVTDEYVLHDIKMPQTYIDNAEAELLVKAQDYLEENSSPNVVYDITPDPIYFEENLINLDVGDIIEINDADFGISITTKIIEIRQCVVNPYKYALRVGNRAHVNFLTRVQLGLESNYDYITKESVDRRRENERIANRINDLNDIPDLIFDVDGYLYSDKIRPLSIETQSLTVGARSLQLNFIELEIEQNYTGNPNMLRISDATLVHYVIEETPREWSVDGNIFLIPDNDFRYLYAVVDIVANTGIFLVTNAKITVTGTPNKYTFLVGVIHEVQDGTRGLSMLYGQTFINGRFITTGRVQSIDGLNFFDLDQNQFKIGNSESSIDWSVTTPNKLTIKGTLIQSPSGDEFPATIWRGPWDSETTYFWGDVVSEDGSTWIALMESYGDRPSVNPAVWELYVSQGNAGADGADGFGTIPLSISPAQRGGFSDYVFTINSANGSENAGEVDINGTKIVKPNGDLVEYVADNTTVLTPYGEATAGDFYIILSETNNNSRVPSITFSEVSRFIPVTIVNGAWHAVSNSPGVTAPITLLSSDVFLGAFRAEDTTGGITFFAAFTAGVAGADGEDGEDGSTGPSIVFRGLFQNGMTLYNNPLRRDVVKYNDIYYLFNGTNEQTQASFIVGRYENFGAQFESVATNLLLAENANIGDWIIKDGKISSQQEIGGDPKAQLDGVVGALTLKWLRTIFGATGSSSQVTVTMSIDPDTGGIEITRPSAQGQPYSEVSFKPDHIYINGAKPKGNGSDVYDGRRIAIESDVVADQDYIVQNEYVAAVFGAVNNLGSAPGWGGYFENLFATNPHFKQASASSNMTVTDQFFIWSNNNSGSITVNLPTGKNRWEGRIVLVKRATSGGVIVNGNGVNIRKAGSTASSDGLGTVGRAGIYIYTSANIWELMYVGL